MRALQDTIIAALTVNLQAKAIASGYGTIVKMFTINIGTKILSKAICEIFESLFGVETCSMDNLPQALIARCESIVLQDRCVYVDGQVDSTTLCWSTTDRTIGDCLHQVFTTILFYILSWIKGLIGTQKMCVFRNYECVRTEIHGYSYAHCVLNSFAIGGYPACRDNSSDDDNWVIEIGEGDSSDCDVLGEPINYSHMFHSMNTHDNTYNHSDVEDESEEENADDEENEGDEDNDEEEDNEVEGEVRIYSQTYNLRLLERISSLEEHAKALGACCAASVVRETAFLEREVAMDKRIHALEDMVTGLMLKLETKTDKRKRSCK
jgi:hypothetical protein